MTESREWLSARSSRPQIAGWYPCSTDRDPSCYRLWNGTEWSMPVYLEDPIENWQSAAQRPAQLEVGADPYWLSARLDRFVDTQTPATMTAPEMLDAAARHIRDRAATYDKPEGERSMGQTVAAFNAITGRDLRESEGWLLMELLKAVRDFTTPGGHADSQEDRVAYAALGAEARRAGR